MQRLFVLAASAAALAFLAHAAFAPFYEKGGFVYGVPTAYVLVAGFFAAAARRVQWTWRWVQAWSWMQLLFSLIWPPSPEQFGELTLAARLLAGMEACACAAVLACMWNASVKHWFGPGAAGKRP